MATKSRSVFDFLPPAAEAAPSAPQPAEALRTPRGWTELDPAQRARAIEAIRTAHAARDFNTATALIVALVGGDEARAKFGKMLEIDRAAAARGYISEADFDDRASLTAWALTRLGFDPRRQDGPRPSVVRAAPPVAPSPPVRPAAPVVSIARVAVRAAPVAAMPPARPLALTEGIAAPLKAGDWAELWRRVETGAISAQDAEGFGAVWLASGSGVRN